MRILNRIPLAFLAALLWAGVSAADNPRVELKTTRGAIVLELYPEKAPKTVANFLKYVEDGFYAGTLFHRVKDGFMIQGGGLDREMKEKPTRAPIENEAANGLRNDVGTLAMARRPHPHSASAQFFINVANNDFLNFRDATAQGFGYAVFGRVVSGMDVVGRIARVATGNAAGHQDVPVEPVLITSASVVGAKTPPASRARPQAPGG